MGVAEFCGDVQPEVTGVFYRVVPQLNAPYPTWAETKKGRTPTALPFNLLQFLYKMGVVVLFALPLFTCYMNTKISAMS